LDQAYLSASKIKRPEIPARRRPNTSFFSVYLFGFKHSNHYCPPIPT